MRLGALARTRSPLTYADPAAPFVERAFINIIELLGGRANRRRPRRAFDPRGHEGVPSREQLDPFTLRPWLGHISIYEAVEDGHDFRIRLEGTSIASITGEDWTGKRATDVDARYGCRIAEFMREIVRTHRPMIHTMHVFQNEVESITRLLLPVRTRRDGPVDQVFLVIYVDPPEAMA
jgi:hypothetical protein